MFICVQFVGGELSPEQSGFANPLYDHDDAAAAAAAAAAATAAEASAVRMDDDDSRPATGAGFRPADDDESGSDTLQLVERDVDD